MDKHLKIFNLMDHRAPKQGAQDFRTRTYLAHRYMTIDKKAELKNTFDKSFLEDRLVLKARTTEYKDQYEPLTQEDLGKATNPKLQMKQQYMKPFEDVQFSVIPRPMFPPNSLSHEDYTWNPDPPEPPRHTLDMTTRIKTTPIMFNSSDRGPAKYLDAGATTYKISYVHRTPQQILSGYGAHDNITFWNWKKFKFSAPPVPKVKAKDTTFEPVKLPKFVPNYSLRTEMRDNYTSQVLLKTEIPVRNPKRYDIFVKMPSEYKPESTMIGSGERTVKYV
ncbi:uncharacterized protein LOC119689712 [Teleopsis dalmanni]|uniref:uncharacterized protein LOC119689712 n=1 Tax=Teleopsis dalmanni TaxID=139649 RepID=UPI0018CDCF6E|nr:uncharacterized protein LOC119689712 [Teleopsis dalmanni]